MQEIELDIQQKLINRGWQVKNGILVRYSNPRIGLKPDGTLIIGYHEYLKKVKTLEELYGIIGDTEYRRKNDAE